MSETLSPLFHPGELAAQDRMGVRERIARHAGHSIRPFMTEQQRDFFGQLAYAFLASVDTGGQPWASMVAGAPGFMTTPDAITLALAPQPFPHDILHDTLSPGAPIALLGVQFPTRRRNRAIGHVADAGPAGFTIAVEQTMGVCPKYIQARDAMPIIRAPLLPQYRSPTLDAAARALIACADTFFVASNNPAPGYGPDISHRGGQPGFIRIDGTATITTPDFVGNFLFNTIGNFQVDNRAGVLIPGFDTGDTLQLAARAEIIWDGPELASFPGAQRLVRYHITQAVRTGQAIPLTFTPPVPSPVLPGSGLR